MNWDRVPIVWIVVALWRGIAFVGNRLFVRLPLFMVGYRWCYDCDRRISPREKMERHFRREHAFELERTVVERLCDKCSERRKKRA